jgi:hypothetical protein
VVVIDPRDIPQEKVASTVEPTPAAKQLPATYYVTNGTSNATMYAAGAAAVLWSAHPSMHAVQVLRALESTGGEAHSNERGFGVLSLRRLPADQSPPRISATENDAETGITIMTSDPRGQLIADRLPRPWGQSGVAAIAVNTMIDASGPWTVTATTDEGPAFYDGTAKCSKLCTLSFDPSVTTINLRVIDSTELVSLGGTWNGTNGNYSSFTLVRKSVLKRQTKTLSTTRPKSKSTPTTTVDPNIAAFAAYRASFAQYPAILATTIDYLQTVFPVTYVRPKNIFDADKEAQKLGMFEQRICDVEEAIIARIYNYPGAPAEAPQDPKWMVGYIGCGKPIAIHPLAGIANDLVNGKVAPLGDQPGYKAAIIENRYKVECIKAFVESRPYPPDPT